MLSQWSLFFTSIICSLLYLDENSSYPSKYKQNRCLQLWCWFCEDLELQRKCKRLVNWFTYIHQILYAFRQELPICSQMEEFESFLPSICITGPFIFCLLSFSLICLVNWFTYDTFDVIKELTKDIHILFENTWERNTNAWYHVSSLKKGLISACWYYYRFILLILICMH